MDGEDFESAKNLENNGLALNLKKGKTVKRLSYKHWYFLRLLLKFRLLLRWLEWLDSFLWLSQKSKGCHFFQVTQLLFWNTGFIIDVPEGFIKKWFELPGKTVHRKQLLPDEHFLLSRAPTCHKNFKINQLKYQFFLN